MLTISSHGSDYLVRIVLGDMALEFLLAKDMAEGAQRDWPSFLESNAAIMRPVGALPEGILQQLLGIQEWRNLLYLSWLRATKRKLTERIDAARAEMVMASGALMALAEEERKFYGRTLGLPE